MPCSRLRVAIRLYLSVGPHHILRRYRRALLKGLPRDNDSRHDETRACSPYTDCRPGQWMSHWPAIRRHRRQHPIWRSRRLGRLAFGCCLAHRVSQTSMRSSAAWGLTIRSSRTLFRYSKAMAGKASHRVGSTTQAGSADHFGFGKMRRKSPVALAAGQLGPALWLRQPCFGWFARIIGRCRVPPAWPQGLLRDLRNLTLASAPRPGVASLRVGPAA